MSYKIKTKYEGQGVYAIFNRDQYKVYVGSTQEILKRAKSHQSNLKNNKHPVKAMQKDYNNGDRLEFVVLEETNFCEKRRLHLHENAAIYNMIYDDFCMYNTDYVKGDTQIERCNYLANIIANQFNMIYCHDTHSKVDKFYHGVGYFRTSCILREQWKKRREKREQDTTSDS